MKMQRLIVPTVLEQKLFGTQVTREEWTAKTVRQDLPDVQVKFMQAGKPVVITCIVSGRKETYATVRPFSNGSAMSWSFSWDAIARSLNTGRPLLSASGIPECAHGVLLTEDCAACVAAVDRDEKQQ